MKNPVKQEGNIALFNTTMVLQPYEMSIHLSSTLVRNLLDKLSSQYPLMGPKLYMYIV